MQVCLSAEENQRLQELYMHARKIYGSRASRARIIGKLILDTGDPIQRKEKEIRELVKRINTAQNDLRDMQAARVQDAAR